MNGRRSTSPDVAVLILTYNDPVYVKDAIRSVLNQSTPSIKIKLLDNGSTDHTPETLRAFDADPRITIIRNPRNQRSEFGVREALQVTEKYFCFLFSDDEYVPDRIERMREKLESNPTLAAVFSNNSYIDENGARLAAIPATAFAGNIASMTPVQHLRHFLFQGNTLHPCAMLIRTEDYRRLGGFKPYLHRIGDMEFFVRLLSEVEVAFLPDAMQNIRIFRNGRNESHANLQNPLAVALERSRFLEAYRSQKIVSFLPEILHESRYKLEKAGSAARLFYLGHRLFDIPTVDHQIFAIKCMYDAYESDPQVIDALCNAEMGKSFSQYAHDLQGSPHLNRSLQTLRNFCFRREFGKLPGGTFVYSVLRKVLSR